MEFYWTYIGLILQIARRKLRDALKFQVLTDLQDFVHPPGINKRHMISAKFYPVYIFMIYHQAFSQNQKCRILRMIRMFDFYIIKNILRIKNLNGLFLKLTFTAKLLNYVRAISYLG